MSTDAEQRSRPLEGRRLASELAPRDLAVGRLRWIHRRSVATQARPPPRPRAQCLAGKADDLDVPGPQSTDPALLQRLSAARVLELTPDIAIVTDLDGIILYGNRALERRVGVPVEQLIGRPTSDVLHPEDLASAAPAWQELVAGETRRGRVRAALRLARDRLALVPGQRRHRSRARRDHRHLPGDHRAARRRGALPARLRGRRHRHGDHRHRRALRARQPLAGGDAGLRAASSWPGSACATSPMPPTTRATARRCARSRPAS